MIRSYVSSSESFRQVLIGGGRVSVFQKPPVPQPKGVPTPAITLGSRGPCTPPDPPDSWGHVEVPAWATEGAEI